MYMDSQGISREVEKTLIRYRAGLLSQEQASQELALLSTILKAYETTVLEGKIDKIEAVLGRSR